jgi:uncharacterized integral membrane protein (TIGR00701 family)
VSGSSGLTLKRRCATRTEGSERCVLSFILVAAYPWIKSLHIVAMVAWMAGLFYLPRLFVYHSERASPGSEQSETFKIMERKLLRLIMNPAMAATWILGILLAITPGIVDWSGAGWIYVNLRAHSVSSLAGIEAEGLRSRHKQGEWTHLPTDERAAARWAPRDRRDGGRSTILKCRGNAFDMPAQL